MRGILRINIHQISNIYRKFGRKVQRSLSTTSWIDHQIVPHKVKPYLRLARCDKQIGTLLLMWPCFWGVALATPNGFLDLVLLSKFAVGAFIMRGAGCTINDMWDKDFDKSVERTKSRPIASGELSMKQAGVFLIGQLTCGLGVLISFDVNSIILGFASMPLVVAYPLMKRFTNWPQFVLGLTFNWGALMGWCAVNEQLSLVHAVPLYLSGVCWTLVYDTIYGYQDRHDDAKIGIKSTALYLGEKPQLPLTAISSGMLGGLFLTGYLSELSLPFYIGSVGAWTHLMWQIWTADVNNASNLWARFNSNKYIGALLTLAISFGRVNT